MYAISQSIYFGSIDIYKDLMQGSLPKQPLCLEILRYLFPEAPGRVILYPPRITVLSPHNSEVKYLARI